MSPRLKKLRKVLNPPAIKGFKPYGPEVSKNIKEPVLLHYEEYEAFRLCDYDMYNHKQASVEMGISRPTFTRIYASVRKKLAKAFVEGRQITIDGGKVYFDSDWYSCKSCRCFFNNPNMDVEITCCPLCGQSKVEGCDVETNCFESEKANCLDVCICPNCNNEQPHRHGYPCNQEICPQCGKHMIRKIKST
jgi:predicted DNA-binding protein (UPF0251 family)